MIRNFTKIKNQARVFFTHGLTLSMFLWSSVGLNAQSFKHASLNSNEEIKSLRTKSTKQFAKSDGSFKLVSSTSSLHYKENGQWEDINLAIESNTSSSNTALPFASLKNSFKTFYPGSYSSPIVTETEDGKMSEVLTSIFVANANGESVYTYEEFQQQEARPNNNSIEFTNVLPGTSVRYTNLFDGRKFDVVLNTKDLVNLAPQDGEFVVLKEKIEIPASWTIVKKGSSIHLMNGKTIVAELAQPMAHDNIDFIGENGVIDGTIEWVVENGVNYILTKFPLAWLKDNSRIYPLTLDPIVNYYPVSASMNTGYMTSATAGKANGFLRLAASGTLAWAKFDISTLPAGATIASGDYHGYHYTTNSGTKIANIVGMQAVNPVTATNTAINTQVTSGPNYNSNYQFGTTTFGWRVGAINATGLADIASQTAQGFTALGFNLVSGSTTFMYQYGWNGTNPPFLQLDYSTGPCTSPPTAGTATSSNPSICFGTPFSISLTNGTNGTGQTYQWQSSSDSTNWTNISGATGANYTNSTQTVGTYYRCIVTCSSLSDTTNGVLVSMNPFSNCYCTSGSSSNTYGYIGTFDFSDISTVSTIGCQSYTNYQIPANTGNVFLGNTYNLAAYINSCTGTTAYNAFLTVYIDYNQNGSFTDPGEMVLGNAGTYFQTLGGNITIPATATLGTTGMRVIVVESGSSPQAPCGTYTWGETEDYLITISPPPANDAGISAITRPQVPACTLGDSLFVELSNAGTLNLTSCVLNWSVNGINQTSAAFSGSVAPNTISNEIFVGTYSFNPGDVVKVWTSGPNNVTDSFANNDTTLATMIVAMYGNYTVGGNNPDFPNFTSALNAVIANGVCDDVTFIVHDSTYVEQLNIPQILGSSMNAQVTFQSAGGTDTSVVLMQTSAGSASNYVIRLNGGEWFNFKNMSIINTSATYGRVIQADGGSNITFENTNLITDTLYTSTSTNKGVLYSASGSVVNNLSFLNSNLRGGGYCIYFYGGSTSNLAENLTFDNCEITHYYYRGAYLYYQNAPKIRNSYFYSDKNYTSQYAIQGYYMDNDMEIVGNRIIGNQFGAPLYAMYLYYCDGSPVNKSTIANNMVALGDSTLGNSFYGMLFYYSGNSRVVNNSFNILGTSINQRGIQVGYGGLVDVMNNNINVQSGYTIYSVDAYTIANTDYNNLKTGGSSFGYFGSVQADLAAWQAATNQDANSISVDPMFFGPKDLHVCSSDLDNAGMSLPYITIDNDGEMRGMMADIGADEFSSIAKFTGGDDFTICDGDTVILNTFMNFDDTTIWMGTDTTRMYAITAGGTYTVSSSNTCGIAYDTIMVAAQQNVALQNDTLICSGDQIIVDANVANGTYTWSGGESTQTITVSESGTYAVTVVDADGCTSTDDVLVQQPAGVDLSNDTSFCAGSSIFVDAGIPNASYNWSNGLPNAQIVSVNSTGVYSVTVTDINGCISTDAIDVTAIPQPDANFTQVVSFTTFIGSVANPYSGSTYTWDFGDGDSDTDTSVTHFYATEGTYTVVLTVTNECGTSNFSSEVVIAGLGFNELNSANGIKVYPNPTNSFITITSTTAATSNATIEVIDMAGRVILTKNTTTKTQLNEQIDLGNFASGVYSIKITMDNAVDVIQVAVQD